MRALARRPDESGAMTELARGAASTPPARVSAFDWLRGVAVLFMIQCHALVLLREDLRGGRLHRELDVLDGLVAPAFLFAAGFSLAFVQVRGAASGQRASRARKSLRRIGEVLGVASLVNAMWFPIWREPEWLLRLDILHCVGLSLLLALPVFAALGTRPKTLVAVSALLAAAVFALAPLAEHASGPLERLVRPTPLSLFPLVPWAGYVFLGGTAGALAAAKPRRWLGLWLGALFAAGGGLWKLAKPLQAAYGDHHFWLTNPADAGRRWMWVAGLVLLLLAWERTRWRPALLRPVAKVVEGFGSSSMAAYFFHEALLFFRVFGFSFRSAWGERCSWPQYALLVLVLIALTYGLTQLSDRAYAWLHSEQPSPRPKLGARPVGSG